MIIGLADCNNFFVSCERTLDPSLCGKAVVVLSNNDGCAVARSNEAKALGVKMGQPAFELKPLISSGRLIALSGNHLLYRRISLQVHDIMRRYAPSTLDYSVDEAFLLMDGIPESELMEIGTEICDTCMKEAGIPVTIGFAQTKTLAKIATVNGKKKGVRVNILTDPEDIREILAVMPVQDLWGIGRRLAKRLLALNIYTTADFAARPKLWVRNKFGINGERTWRELHGESCIELQHIGRSLQDSISETRTFPIDVNDFDYLRARIAIYCAHVSKRLRAMNGEAGTLTVFLRTNRFHLERGYFAPSISVDFDPPTSDAARITQAGVKALSEIFNPSIAYKRAGVILSDIRPQKEEFSIFDSKEDIEAKLNSKKLMKVIDSLNQGVGPHLVKLASQITKGHIGHNDGYSSSFGAPSSNG